MMKKFLSVAMTLALSAALCVPAFAANAPSGAANSLVGGKSTNVIPVTISAEATTFNVDIPTAFPIVLDPTTGEVTTADNAVITNYTAGSIAVSKIEAQDNAMNNNGDATWHLASFSKDMSKVTVDSNLIGFKIQPKSNRNGATAGTALATVDGAPDSQILLDKANSEWVIDGKGAEDGGDSLTVLYDANASAVSSSIINETIANIIITISLNKGVEG